MRSLGKQAVGDGRFVNNLTFEYGRPIEVSRQLRPRRRREFLVLAIVVTVTALPYAWAIAHWPLPTLVTLVCLALIQAAAVFVHSATQGLSHTVRFQLAGSNPLAMTGGMALLLGGVDAVLDLRDDRLMRRRNPLAYTAHALLKLAVCPLGMVLMAMEFAWDLLCHRGGARLIGLKLHEFFRVAWHHDFVCPEKSNDIFYADFAVARQRNDPYLYQWNRLRAFVFELQHYWRDWQQGLGRPETNLLCQSVVAAYQSLRRLEMEQIQVTVDRHYRHHWDRFPLRPLMAERLVNNAKPIEHFLHCLDQRDALLLLPIATGQPRPSPSPLDGAIRKAILSGNEPWVGSEQEAVEAVPSSLIWGLLRLCEDNGSQSAELPSTLRVSPWAPPDLMTKLLELKVIAPADHEANGEPVCSWSPHFLQRWELLLASHFVEEPDSQRQRAWRLARVPQWLQWRGKFYRES